MIRPASRRDVAAQFEQLKRRVFGEGSAKVRLAGVASATEHEGTTTVAVNLAVGVASGQKSRVLLMDGNLRRPALHRIFDLELEEGMTELLGGGRQLEEVVRRTALPNLLVVTAGEPVSEPSELFGAANFRLVLDAAQAFDCILVDCPPVNRWPEATAIAAETDGVILVVRAESVRREVVSSAKERLLAAGANVLGVVLNRRRYHIPGILYRAL